MPSGSHSGSFGSHSSGGASFGGGSHHSGSSGHSGGFFPGGAIFIFGRRYEMKSKWSGLLLFLTFFSLILGIVAAIVTSTAKSTVSKIETDYTYYQAMIQKAESDPQYKTTAIITDKFLNEDCGKWYLTYKFKTTDGANWVEGYTFSVYSNEEANAITINSTTDLAVNSYPITEKTDSITMDYKDMPLEKDGEYTIAKKQIVLGRVGYILCIVAIAGTITGAVLLEKKAKENEAAEKQKEQEFQLKTEELKKDAETRTCPYCGAKLPKDVFTCPNCGANTK